MQKGLLLILVFSAVILFFIWSSVNKRTETPHIGSPEFVTVLIDDVMVSAELSDTFSKRAQGLSGISILEENEGMLFIFEKSDPHGIWMKDMRFPIDILWIDDNLRIVDVKKNALPESYPEVFIPKEKAKYVLEVNTGFSDVFDVNVGDSISLN